MSGISVHDFKQLEMKTECVAIWGDGGTALQCSIPWILGTARFLEDFPRCVTSLKEYTMLHAS